MSGTSAGALLAAIRMAEALKYTSWPEAFRAAEIVLLPWAAGERTALVGKNGATLCNVERADGRVEWEAHFDGETAAHRKGFV